MDIQKRVRELNGFADFNQMQSAVLKKNWENKNLVVSAPTASGKTVIAELLALNSIVNNKKKVVYTCPLRALASEHYNDFKKKFSQELNVKAAISTGDFDSASSYLQNNDIIYTTYEKLDSLIRHRSFCLSSIGLLVLDEVHELDSDRGPTLEMLVTKMRFLNPNMQLLALSATIPNADEIAKWLDAELVESDFRPVKLREGVFFEDEIHFPEQKEKIASSSEAIFAIINDTLHLKEKQALIFVNTRRHSEGMAKKLSALTEKRLSEKEKNSLKKASERVLNVLETPTEQCVVLSKLVKKGVAFHNAGLLQRQREIVEQLFKSNLLKVIVATTTLGAGVNLPAFRVIIPSLFRYTAWGQKRIPVREYKQLCVGRNSKLFTDRFGFLEIGKIVEKKIKCNVLSFNNVSFKAEFKPVQGFFSKKTFELIRLTLGTANKLDVTPDHKLCVYRNGFSWKKACDLKKGELLVFCKVLPKCSANFGFFFEFLPIEGTFVVKQGKLFFQAKKKLKISERKLAAMMGVNHKLIYHWKKNKKAMKLKAFLALCNLLGFSKEKIGKSLRHVKSAYGTTLRLPKLMNNDFLWLAGFIATDGNINYSVDKRTGSKYAKIRVFNKNAKLIAKATKVLKLFGLSPQIAKREDGFISLEVGATLLAFVLRNHFGICFGNKSHSVATPKFLLNYGKDAIGAYLGGVFDGDGNYNVANQKKGINSKVYRVLIATGSKNFAFGIQSLLLRLGIVSSVTKEKTETIRLIRGKPAFFKKPVYSIVFRKIEYIKKFSKYAKIFKTKIDLNYSVYHNVNKRDRPEEEFELVKLSSVTKLKKEKEVYDVSVKGNKNYFAEGVLVHNCGRAGRPKFDSAGEAILIARSEMEIEELMENYVNGKTEDVNSRLGIEPVLRMHLLAAIANDFVFDWQSLEDFFGKTFYALQFGSLSSLFEKISLLLAELQRMGFVDGNEKQFKATVLGKRVSELYLDPLSAFNLIQNLKHESLSDFAFFFAFAGTFELFPLVSVQRRREAELWEKLQSFAEDLPYDLQKEMYLDSDLLRKFNTALLLNSWIDEMPEHSIVKGFGVQPGILRSKLLICDWLSYSAFELSKLLGFVRHLPKLVLLRKRLKKGIRAELIPLCELKWIGRVRARKLWHSNIRTIGALKEAPLDALSRLLGVETAVKVKKQLGLEPEKTDLPGLENRANSQKGIAEF